jgi:hypothetical protein
MTCRTVCVVDACQQLLNFQQQQHALVTARVMVINWFGLQESLPFKLFSCGCSTAHWTAVCRQAKVYVCPAVAYSQ